MGVGVGTKLRRLVDDEGGATAVEYAIILALILMVIFFAVVALGVNVNQAFENFIARFSEARS